MRLSLKANVVEQERNRITQLLSEMDPWDDRYSKMANNLVRLSKAMNEGSSLELNPNVVATILVNIFGIISILNFEKINVLSSKAVSILMRPRL